MNNGTEVLRQAFQPTAKCVGASIKIPNTSQILMLKVRNFDDPNLCSYEYQFLSFNVVANQPPHSLSNSVSDAFLELNPIFELDAEEIVLPSAASETILEEPEISGEQAKPTPSVGIDKFLVYNNIVNGVASTLLAIEFKKLLKLKLGMVPALLSLLSENACTVILCLTIPLAESDIISSQRNVPLQPQMLFDYLQNELGIDRFKKTACMLAESLTSDPEIIIDDDSSDYSPEEGENYSTSDEDYEEESQKVLRSHPSTGPRLRLSVKLEDPKNYVPTSRDSEPPNSGSTECDWENCLVCERDIPIMLQAQNPTWAAIMRVVFYSFIHIFPNCEYWMVRQAYKFIEDHWEKLCPGKNKSGAWRKQLQDALSHNKQYFVSGMDKFGQKGDEGYWGLKQMVDPWAITDQDDHPKRAYHHQPRRGRPPKSSSAVRSQMQRKDSKYYICK